MNLTQEYGFARRMAQAGLGCQRQAPTTLQLNITRLCNQVCTHCHVDASPRRREMMGPEVLARCLELFDTLPSLRTLDVTGGAPELHPGFVELVNQARQRGLRVIVRHNLTVTEDKHPLNGQSMSWLPEYFAKERVELVSSLPYYKEYFTDRQRGSGVFHKSIASLRKLNALGYGHSDSGLILNLVYNPVGPFLPPAQQSLEQDYKRELGQRFGIVFNQLLAITNMPIHRFKAQLVRLKSYESYMETLVRAFNPAAAEGIMCLGLLSIDHDGLVYDCDFNQMLDLPLQSKGAPLTVFDLDEALLQQLPIQVGDHCYGCTAGAGSSCGGNTAKASSDKIISNSQELPSA